MNRLRLPIWRILGGIVLTLAAAALAIWGWIDRVADRRWAAFLQRQGELRDEVRRQDGLRPVLRGTPLPGDAWEDYLAAHDMVKNWRTQFPPFPSLGQSEDPKDRLVWDQYLAQMGPPLDRLRRGASRENGDYAYSWEKGSEGLIPYLHSTGYLTIAGRLQARRLVLDGKPLQAAELLLDFLQLWRDMLSHSTLSAAGRSTYEADNTNEDLREILCTCPLSAPELREIERQLEVLDSAYPSAVPLWTNELLVLGYDLKKPGGGSLGGSSVRPSELWKYGFSTRIAAADAFFRSEEMVKFWRELEGQPWNPAQDPRQFNALVPVNPLFNHALNRFMIGTGTCRAGLVPLRLLRVAARFRATGEWLDLDDPLGDKLHHSIDGNRLKAWSVGPDGKDDGGDVRDQVNWLRPGPIPGKAALRPARDMVIKVTR